MRHLLFHFIGDMMPDFKLCLTTKHFQILPRCLEQCWEKQGSFFQKHVPSRLRLLDSLRAIPVTVISKTRQTLRHCGFWKCHKENQQKRNGANWQKQKFGCQVLNNVQRGRPSVSDILGAFGKQDHNQFTTPCFFFPLPSQIQTGSLPPTIKKI